MFIGPPSSLPATEARFSAGASWSKPLSSPDTGVPQLDGALHLPGADAFDLAVRAWTLGGGLQGRVVAASRERGAPVDVMVAPLLGVSTLLDYKEEGDERLLPPIDVEFLVTLPVVMGVGVGLCSIYGGGEPIAHLRPDLFMLRVAAVAGFACPTQNGQQIAPELAIELPVVGADELRPENGFEPGQRRHPLLAPMVRFGVMFSF